MTLHLVLIGCDDPALAHALRARGHEVTEVAAGSAADLVPWRGRMAAADAVVLDGAAPDLAAQSSLVQASAGGLSALRFGDPLVLASLFAGCEPPPGVDGFDLVLSALGGAALARIEAAWRVRRAVAFHTATELPAAAARPEPGWDLGLLEPPPDGASAAFARLFLDVARSNPKRRFVVAARAAASWPENVDGIPVPSVPGRRALYARVRWSLNLVAPALAGAGFAPGAAMFDAAAAGTGILCEPCSGLGVFFMPGRDLVAVAKPADVARALFRPEAARAAMAASGRARVLGGHLVAHRAAQLESLVAASLERRLRLVSAGR